MEEGVKGIKWALLGVIGIALLSLTVVFAQEYEKETFMPVVIKESFLTTMARDKAEKPRFMKRQMDLLNERYDLSNRPAKDVMMSGGRKPVQEGVRVKLPAGMTWEKLAMMSPAEIREKDLFPKGLMPLPHAKHETGGQVFPRNQIDEIMKMENRSLERFDVEFDLPDHFTPEFPPPIYLTTHPELGDVSQGKLLSFKN